nr:SapC family protein [Sandaracinobacteroides sayramensis]
MTGFQIVDREKLRALDGETVVAWHRSGVLAPIEHHLVSLDRFRALLDCKAAWRRHTSVTGQCVERHIGRRGPAGRGQRSRRRRTSDRIRLPRDKRPSTTLIWSHESN